MIRITSQREGFRRAGRPHSTTPTEYPDDAFTPEQLDALTAEPMLLVEFISDQPAAAAAEVAEASSSGEGREVYLVAAIEIPAVAQTANPPVAAVREDDERAEAAPAPRRNRRKKGE